jgi:hypothetical protein
MDMGNLDAIATRILPFIGAALVAYVIYIIGQQLSKDVFKRNTTARVKDLIGVREEQKVKPSDFGSEEFKIRLAFSKYNIEVYKHEKLALNITRLTAVLVMVGIMHFIFGLPLVTSMVGGLGGIMIVNSFAAGAWINMCNEVDKEIPIFLSGFTSTIQVNPNVLQAVEEESSVLAANSPLKRWLLDRFVKMGQERGVSVLEELVAEAFRISNSLGVMVFLIGRLWRTGGMEWKRSFALAAANLEGVMEARLMGVAAGNSAKGAVKLIIGVTLFIILVMARNPVFKSSMESPVVQAVYAVSILMMIFGYGFMSNMVDSLM